MAGHSVTPRLAIEGVWKEFGRRPVLRNASVWASAGTVTVLFGRNGQGKSTLLRCGLGLLRADAGVTIFGDTRASPASLPTLARNGLFFLPDRDLLADGVRVGHQLHALLASFPEAVLDPLDGLLPDALDRLPATLSGGERRVLETWFAQVRRPTVLVADEPLRGLAPRTADAVADRLRNIARNGAAVLVTGHETRSLLAMADHVVWMTGGTTHHLGNRDAALGHAQFRLNYLSDP
jgi:ABC-type multidrug transport system ATPase subunit